MKKIIRVLVFFLLLLPIACTQENNITKYYPEKITNDTINPKNKFSGNDSNTQGSDVTPYCPDEMPNDVVGLGNEFSGNDKCIYYKNEKIIDADPETFEILSDFFSRDENFAYCGCTKIEGANPATFEVLTDYYAADKDHVYYRVNDLGSDIDNCGKSLLDPESFVAFEEGFAGDSKYIFIPIIGIIFDKSFTIDPSSFEVINSPYVKDANGIYFLSIRDGFKIEEADRDSFEVLGNGKNGEVYAKDKNYCYANGKIIDCETISTN